MPLTTSITVHLDGVNDALDRRFGYGSKGQAAWSEIVFDESADYVPFKEGGFFEHSRTVSEPLFAQGELLYQAPPDLGYDYLPRFLWDGRSRHGAIIIKNYTTTTHALAGGQWAERAKNDRLPIMAARMQEKIDRGDV